MMGKHEPQKDLFNYAVDLDQRVPAEHALRRIDELVDFRFVREEVSEKYGYNGNVSVDPAVILKLMFLLFFDDISSERELMRMLPYRLDYLWFLGYGLDAEVPNHSVLSKARSRWGEEVFEKVFTRVVEQCVESGLVEGQKIHMDGSLIAANASKGSVVKGSPELIAALRATYQDQERKLEIEEDRSPSYEAVNDRAVSTTDPDSALVRKDGDSRPRYKNHRVVDDAHGVITAVKTTRGDVKENGQLTTLIEEHERNTGIAVGTVVADKQYGTEENFLACQERGIRSHMGDFRESIEGTGRRSGIFGTERFEYDAKTDTYECPAGERLRRRKQEKKRSRFEYAAAAKTCLECSLREQCTRAKGTARTIKRAYQQEVLDVARAQSHSMAAKRDRVRRKWLMEGSFADAANNHGFKRARWRRQWRQSIQDYLIATCQNIRILLRHGTMTPKTMPVVMATPLSVSSSFAECRTLDRSIEAVDLIDSVLVEFSLS